jgi:hypothetical protein
VGHEAVKAILAKIWGTDKRGRFRALEIDKVIDERRDAKRPPRIVLPSAVAREAARRAMEEGLYQVLNIRENLPSGAAADFAGLEKKAITARKALSELLRHLEPRDKSAADLELPIVSVIAPVDKIDRLDAKSLHKLARRDSQLIWATRRVIRRLESGAVQKTDQARRSRPTSTKPEHAAFAEPLGDCWLRLTGRVPGRGNADGTRNKFLPFVRAAWMDVFGHEDGADDPDFVGAMRALAFDDLRRLDGLRMNGELFRARGNFWGPHPKRSSDPSRAVAKVSVRRSEPIRTTTNGCSAANHRAQSRD